MQRTFLLALLLSAIPGTAMAASGNASSATGRTSAQVVAPLTLAHNAGTQLSFGKFTVSAAGTVTVSATTGTGSATGGVAFATGSATSMDFLTATGDPNRLIGIVTGSGTITAGASSMSFTTRPNLNAGFLPAGGSGFFTVGGTLTVNANQPGGIYTGSYAVTVTYQ